ncbi:MAG: hypothetical protein Q9215_005460 [Flavoplaca cf. flavocitrina]
MAGLMNDQPPPPYEEISSAPAHRHRNGSGRGAIEADERNPFQQLSNHITNEIYPINQPPTDNPHTKLIIPSTHPTILQFPYHPHLSSSLGISELEWTSFTSALASAATLSGAQKAKAISAAVGPGLVVNRWLGVVIDMWIWRREIRGLVLAGERIDDGEKHRVGRVLGEWNRVWERRGLRMEEGAKTAVKEQVVASVRNVESAEDAANRRVITKEESGMGTKAVGHGSEWLNGRGVDSAEDLLVERIEDADQKVDDLERRFGGLIADDANEKTA